MTSKIDTLAESESDGYEAGYAGIMRSRSFDPNENRWLYHYEPDDEHWNAYQYGQGTGHHKYLIEERKPAPTIQPTNDRTKQTTLFDTGANDLPGQKHLFDDITGEPIK